MFTEPEFELAPEIAHVLLMDVVGYSKLLVDDQIVLLRTLNRIVRSTPQFVTAEKDGRLKKLPTGDGMALLFFDSPETPLRCALEISAEVQKLPDIKLRMGIHSGPVKEVMDVNDRANAAGAGIDLAQRVLDCGDAGHILLSQRVAEDLKPYRHWNPYLHDLGECEVKHGLRLRIYSLRKDKIGNPALPERVQEQQKRWYRCRVAVVRWAANSWIKKAILILAPILLVSFLATAWYLTRTTPPLERSIAVLPLVNLSGDKRDTPLIQGIHGEIMTKLSHITGLKVTGPVSVMGYPSGASDRPEIGGALGVAHLLEGSLQRDGNHVHIIVRLFDARTNAVLWGDTYDPDRSDMFAIQTDVTEKIVNQLRVRLSPEQKTLIEKPPTRDQQAYLLYLRGQELLSATFNARRADDLISATRVLDQAVARDPNFLLAYYQLARAHDQLYLMSHDHTPARLALAEAAIARMHQLEPNAGETHLALGEHLYWGYRDYPAAREQLELARRGLPSDSRPFLLLAYLDRRQGRSDESLRNFAAARNLEPRDLNILQQISLSYQYLRRFDDMLAVLEDALSVAPSDVGTQVQRASVDLDWRGDPAPLRAAIDSLIKKNPAALPKIADTWINLALCERNGEEAQRAAAAMTADGCVIESVPYPRSWCAGLAARVRGDTAAAMSSFQSARAQIEVVVRQQPSYGEALSVLALIDAALGRKEEAIAQGKHSLELLPLKEDSINGAILIQNMALVYAWTGEKDLALAQLTQASQIPSLVTYGQLRLHPNWDVLRDDPRFDAIVASLAPK